ncbi:hypothetical protein TVAG_000830 [Trichomonas vaginalis G3]|uniref:Uncharacterized protein n=1 Tax=Trichomonas vaginalis (strain ATCC PRA-98 / G3) TaxID=412133 RepID=A2EHV9_TRIV3|nr:hypothetical protein TVAGG3_0076770 [Trichomonas vaginalis G3]EAY07799.1 hypothetical protein TVAG_000830 [Trichomonas vaginalis G3]KAI5542927.1 hypothetical protein TVAGG3_0076770 [Trichomonas vaginalis G3]|eukprot:XP_001320022.1 hypothetical protein [Trichomonas vaginalis G3]
MSESDVKFVIDRLSTKIPFDELAYSYILYYEGKMELSRLHTKINKYPQDNGIFPLYFSKKDSEFIDLENKILSKYVKIDQEFIEQLKYVDSETFEINNGVVSIKTEYTIDDLQTIRLHRALYRNLSDDDWTNLIKNETFYSLFHTFKISEIPEGEFNVDSTSWLILSEMPPEEFILIYLFAYAGIHEIEIKKLIKLFTSTSFTILFDSVPCIKLIPDLAHVIENSSLFYMIGTKLCLHPPIIWKNNQTGTYDIKPYRHPEGNFRYIKSPAIKITRRIENKNKTDQIDFEKPFKEFRNHTNGTPFRIYELYEYSLLHFASENIPITPELRNNLLSKCYAVVTEVLDDDKQDIVPRLKFNQHDFDKILEIDQNEEFNKIINKKLPKVADELADLADFDHINDQTKYRFNTPSDL